MRTSEQSQLNRVLSQAILEILGHAEQAFPEDRQAFLYEAQEIDRLRIRLLGRPLHHDNQFHDQLS